jgi:ABC-type transporter Mla MlaB component
VAGEPIPPGTVVLALRPAVGRADIADQCHRLAVLLLDSGATVVICDLAAVDQIDVVTIELVARLQLTASRLGRRVRLRSASQRMIQLLTLTGLHHVVQFEAGSGLQPWRQPEEGEQPFGVQEGVDTDDPPT